MKSLIILMLVFITALPTYAGSGEPHYDKAHYLLNSGSGNYALIASELELAVKKDPSNPDIYCMLGEAYDGMDNYSLAASSYARAIEAAEAGPYADIYLGRAYFGRAYAFYCLGLFGNALSDYQAGFEYEFQNHNLYLMMGNCCLWLDNFNEAIGYYNMSIDADTEFPPSKYESRAMAHYCLKDYDKAAADLERSISLYQGSIDPYFYFGVVSFARTGKLPAEYKARIIEAKKGFYKGTWEEAAADYLLENITLEKLQQTPGVSANRHVLELLMAAYKALWAGDEAGARDKFMECEKCYPPYSSESRLAAHELTRR